jgi:NitT/TauT family transport system substrate-binding protein
MLASVNLNESDVTLVHIEAGDMAAAMQKGGVDAVSIWEPHAQSVMDILASDAVVIEGDPIYRETFNLVTTTDILSDPTKRATIVRFITAVIDATEHLKSHPSEITSLLAGKIGLTERSISGVWDRFAFPASLSSDLPDALTAVETWAARVQGARVARARSELVKLVDYSLYEEARVTRR